MAQFQRFKYIYKDSAKIHTNPNEILENVFNRKQINDCFVVAEQYRTKYNNTSYNYLVFDCIDNFIKYRDECEEKPFHEVIFGWQQQKIKFDIDFDDDPDDSFVEELLRSVDEAICTTMYIEYREIIDSDYIINTTSTGFDENAQRRKCSFHKIIAGFYVSDNNEAKEFTKRFLLNLPPIYHKYIDGGINKQIQNFRLIGCHKLGSQRTKRLTDESATMYVDDDTIIQKVNGTLLQSLTDEPDEPDEIMIVSDDIDAAINIVTNAGLLEHHQFTKTVNTLLCFKRLSPSQCNICQRVHVSENSLMVTMSYNDGICDVFELCRRDENSSRRHLGKFYSVSQCINDAVDVKINKRAAAFNTLIEETIADPPDFIDHVELRALEHKNIYESKVMEQFEHVDTLCVIAGMKMGKTKKLVEYINEHFTDTEIYRNSIKFISFRQTFSANIKEKFPEFTLYSDVSDSTLKQLKLIVQVESMHRIDINVHTPVPDLVVLDEVELILEQFSSGLLKQFNKAWATFQWLLRTAKHVVCLDATMSDRTINTLRRMRVDTSPIPRNIFLHHNTYKNSSPDTYSFVTNKDAFYASIYRDIDNGKKIAMPVNSLKEAEILRVGLSKRYPDASIGFYSSKTSATVKKEHFNKVDEYWSLYDILIYTPTVSAGVSFERAHFDRVYAWFTDLSCNVEVCLQMLGRVRNVGDNQYVIGIEINGGYLPTTTGEIKEIIYNQRAALYNMPDASLLQFEYTHDGNIKYYESDYFHLWLENTKVNNISKNNFVKRLATYLHMYGASMEMLDYSEITNAQLKEVNDENANTRTDINNDNAIAITNAVEINQQEVLDIQTKFVSQDDISDADRAAYEKYKIRRDYNYSGKITQEFVTKYSSKKLRRIFKNLVRIHQRDNLADALTEIRRIELERYSDIMNNADKTLERADVLHNYVYERHRIAIALLRCCTYENLTDQQYISEFTLCTVFKQNEQKLYNTLNTAHKYYGIKRPSLMAFRHDRNPDDATYVKGIIGYFNKILDAMYGIRISARVGGLFKLTPLKSFDLVGEARDGMPSIKAKVWHPPCANVGNAIDDFATALDRFNATT